MYSICFEYPCFFHVFYMFFFMFLDIQTSRFFRFPAAYQGNTNLGLGYQASARQSISKSFFCKTTHKIKQSTSDVQLLKQQKYGHIKQPFKVYKTYSSGKLCQHHK